MKNAIGTGSALERLKKIIPASVQPKFTSVEEWQAWQETEGRKRSGEIDKMNQRARSEKIFGRAGIQALHRSCSFANYEVNGPEQRQAYSMAKSYAQNFGGGSFASFVFSGATGQDLTEPVPTITAGTSKRPGGNGHALGMVEASLAPFIGRQFGSSIGHRTDEPSATITAGGGGKSQLVVPTLIQMGYGERPGQAPRVLSLDNPMGTVTAGGNKFATVSAFLAKHYGGNYTGPGIGLDEPAHSVTTVDHHAVVAAHLMVNNTGHPGGEVNMPTHTITTGNHHAAVTSHLVKLRGTCRDGQRTDAPMPTITAGGTHVGEVKTLLAVDAYDEQRAEEALEFLREYCGPDSTGLVTIDGIVYRIVDIGMRMLQPHELYRAQGFPEWYIIDRDYRGVKYAKDKQVARCGNAVPPPFAEALVRANLPELCQSKEIAA